MAMRITIITPAPKESQVGNRITANRWSGILRALGHRTRILMDYDGRPCDVLVVLHARKGHEALARCRREQPQIPIVLALTGTDLYGDIRTDARAQQSLEWADRLIVLQPLGILELPEHLRTRTRVIHQSVEPLARKLKPRTDAFSICVMGHLREVKDPFRAAEAVREMPTSSHIQITHIGSALSPEMAVRAQNEIRLNARYTWLGDVPRARALRLLACSRLLVLSSLMEGGANVVSEALSFGGFPGLSACLGMITPAFSHLETPWLCEPSCCDASRSPPSSDNSKKDVAKSEGSQAPPGRSEPGRSSWAKYFPIKSCPDEQLECASQHEPRCLPGCGLLFTSAGFASGQVISLAEF
jgi:putative glycosyltransferase (TIGR04348 family)